MRALVVAVMAIAVLGVTGVGTTDAAATTSIARLGTTHGASRLTAGTPNRIYINARGLSRGTWSAVLYMGTCSRLSRRILTLPVLTIGASGALARTTTISASQARLAKTGVLRLTRGAAVVCGAFAAEVRPAAIASPTRKPTPKPTPSPMKTPTPAPTPTPGPSSAPGASVVPGGPVGPGPSTDPGGSAVLPFDHTGSGDGTTATFQAPPNWKFAYLFDCAEFGRAGHFSIRVFINGSLVHVAVSRTADLDSGVIRETNRPGAAHLQITSDCDWDVSVAAG